MEFVIFMDVSVNYFFDVNKTRNVLFLFYSRVQLSFFLISNRKKIEFANTNVERYSHHVSTPPDDLKTFFVLRLLTRYLAETGVERFGGRAGVCGEADVLRVVRCREGGREKSVHDSVDKVCEIL